MDEELLALLSAALVDPAAGVAARDKLTEVPHPGKLERLPPGAAERIFVGCERYQCPVHGEIGGDSRSVTVALEFPPSPRTVFCAACIRDLLCRILPHSEKEG